MTCRRAGCERSAALPFAGYRSNVPRTEISLVSLARYRVGGYREDFRGKCAAGAGIGDGAARPQDRLGDYEAVIERAVSPFKDQTAALGRPPRQAVLTATRVERLPGGHRRSRRVPESQILLRLGSGSEPETQG